MNEFVRMNITTDRTTSQNMAPTNFIEKELMNESVRIYITTDWPILNMAPVNFIDKLHALNKSKCRSH